VTVITFHHATPLLIVSSAIIRENLTCGLTIDVEPSLASCLKWSFNPCLLILTFRIAEMHKKTFPQGEECLDHLLNCARRLDKESYLMSIAMLF
jgi:hypothetical protein